MLIVKTPRGEARVVEHASELPDAPEIIDELFADCETRAPSIYEEGLSPYEGARACGWAVTWDSAPGAWYLPIRHADSRWNVELEPALRWLKDVTRRSRSHVNHNVKFDAHFLSADEIEPVDRMVCTLTRAKMIDSDRMGHGLKELDVDWLGGTREDADRVKAYLAEVKLPRRKKCRDYSQVPADVLGTYACSDVLKNRELHRYLLRRMEPDQAQLWETEVKLTSVLFDMERDGLRVDQRANKIEKLRCLRAMVEAAERVKALTGVELVDSNDCFYEIFIAQLGLPVLGHTDAGNPSFEADVMVLYKGHPRVITDARAKEIVDLSLRYRNEGRFLSLFVESFERYLDERGFIHPTYNQLIRTGRMSAQRPNSQQQNERSKSLIIPDEGEAFLCSDASQIEFRTLMHYIQDERALRAYAENPRIDFHQWVADIVGVERGPAKTLNFAMGYGAGKRRVTATLMSNETLVRSVERLLDEDPALEPYRAKPRAEAVEELVAMRAIALYEEYHSALPGLRATSERAAALCRARGYIKNAYGRRRHLPRKLAHRAFNTLNQGCAMDLIKERMVALSPRFNSESKRLGLRLRANVHDEVLQSGPRDWVMRSEESIGYVEPILSAPSVPFRVPFTWNSGVSEKNWAEAKA